MFWFCVRVQQKPPLKKRGERGLTNFVSTCSVTLLHSLLMWDFVVINKPIKKKGVDTFS